MASMQMALHDPGKNRRSAEETEDETARKKFKSEDNMEKLCSNYSHYVNVFNELLMLTESQEPRVLRIFHRQVAVTKDCLDEYVDYMSKTVCKSVEFTPNEPSSEGISSDLVPYLSNNGGPVVCVPRVNLNEEKANLPILSRVTSESTSPSNTWRSKKSFRKERPGPAPSKLKLTVKNVEAHNEYQEPLHYALKRKVQPLSESGSSHSVQSLNLKEIETVQDFSVQLSGKSPQIKLFKVDSKHDSSNGSIEQPQMGTNPLKTTNEESCNKNDLNDNHLNLNSRTNRISSSSRTDDESIFLKPQKVVTEEITKSVNMCQDIFNSSSHCSGNKVTNRKMKKSVKQDSSLHSASDPKDNETCSIEPACGDARKEILSIDNSCSEKTSSRKSKSSALKSLSSSEISESNAVNNAVDKSKIPFLGNEESELFTENDSKDLAREKEDVPILLEVNAQKNYKTVELSTLKDGDCFSILHLNDIDSAPLTNLRSTPKSRISKLNRKHCHLNSGESNKGKAKSKTGEKVVEIGQSLLPEETVAQPEQIKEMKCEKIRKNRNSSFGILSPETKLPLPSFPQNSSSGNMTNEKNFLSDRLEHESAPLVTKNVEKCSSNVKDKPSNCSEEKKTKIESSGHGPCKRSRKKSDNLNAGNTLEKCSNDEWKVRAASPDNMILKIGKTQIDSAAVECKHRKIDEITTPDSKGRSCNDSVKIEKDHKKIDSQQKSDKSKISEKIKIKLREKSVKPSTSKNDKKIDLRSEGKKITSKTGIQPLTSNKKRKIDPAYGGKKITPEIAIKPETPKNEKKIDKKITSEKATKPDQEQAKTSYQTSENIRKMDLENVGKKITPETARLTPQKGLENTEKTIPTRSQIEGNKSETVKEEKTVSKSIACAGKMKSRRNTTDEEYQEILKHVEEVLESVVANVDASKESEPKKSALKQLEDELQISTSSSDASPSDSSKCTTCSSSDSSLLSIENNQSGHDDISTSQVKPSNEPKTNNSKAISLSLTNFQIPKIKCQPREHEVIGPKQTFNSVGEERIDVLKQVEPETHPRTERSLPPNAKAMNEKLKLSLKKRLKPKEKIQGSSNAVPPVSKTDKEVQEKTELKPAPSSIIKNCDSLNAAPSASIMNDPADDFISLTVSDEELDNLDVASSRYSSHLPDLEPKKSSQREKISSSLVAASSQISLSTEPGPPHSSCDGRNSSSENSTLARVKRSNSVDRKLNFSPERVDSGPSSSARSNSTSESSALFQEGSRLPRVERSRRVDRKLNFSPERVDSGPSSSTKSNPTSESSVPHRKRRDSNSTSSQLATQSNDLLYNPLFEIKQMERKSVLFSEQVKIITRLLCCSLLTAKHPPDIIQSETLARIGSFIRNQHDAEPSKYIKEIVNYANRPGSHDEGTKIGTLMYPLKIVVTNLMAWKYVEKDFSEVFSLYENFAVALDVDIFSNPPQIEPIKGKKYSGSWFAIAVIDVFTKNKKHNPCAKVMRRLNLYNLNRNKWKWSNTKDDENFHQCVLTRLFKALMERKEDKQEEKDGFENALKHLALLVITNSRDEQCESDLIEVLHLDINDMFVKFFEVKLFDECQKLSRTLPELILLKLDKSIWRGLVFAAVKASKTQKDEDYAVSLLQLAAEYEIYPHLLAKDVTKDLVVPVPLHLIQEEVKPYIEFYFRNRLVKIVHDESLEVLRNPEEASLTLKIEAFKIKTKYSLPFLNDSMQVEDKVATMQTNIIQILKNFGISANRTELGIVSVNYRSFLAYINSIPPDVVRALTV
ncbi:unnamed protein product [Bemisia tabaci]|uniref:Uncharacterized protein n=1 Tax=Bemisia tabaci TaxID=7038 RepID=A0A9P0F5A2_BEMTA|nr:unnamed protein product [Bemisia tabaci]